MIKMNLCLNAQPFHSTEGPPGICLHRGENLPPDHVGPGGRHPAARAANADPLPHRARRQTKLMVRPQPRRIRRKPRRHPEQGYQHASHQHQRQPFVPLEGKRIPQRAAARSRANRRAIGSRGRRIVEGGRGGQGQFGGKVKFEARIPNDE